MVRDFHCIIAVSENIMVSQDHIYVGVEQTLYYNFKKI